MKLTSFAAILFALALSVLMPGVVDLFLNGDFYGTGKGFPFVWRTSGVSSLSINIFILPFLGNVLLYFALLMLAGSYSSISKGKSTPKPVMFFAVLGVVLSGLLSANLFINPTFQWFWAPYSLQWGSWRFF